MRSRGQAAGAVVLVTVALIATVMIAGSPGRSAVADPLTPTSTSTSTSTTGSSTTSSSTSSTSSTTSTVAPTTTSSSTTSTTLAPTTSPTPALTADFPDPTVLYDDGTYYAYATEVGYDQIQVTSSVDLLDWTPIGDALPTLPSWASPFYTWAPSVVRVGTEYVMYYTARDTAAGRQCISVAVASQPLGPFTDDSSAPLVCQLAAGGSIDPAVFTDPGGTSYLVWKNDGNAIGQVTQLWSQPLTPDGLGLSGSPTALLADTEAWEDSIIEAPAMVDAGGTYYLFYTGGQWATAGAGIGYATCSSPSGPCTKITTGGPWFGSQGDMAGPGSPEFFVGGDGVLRMAFDAWNPAQVGYAAGGERSLWIDEVTFGPAGPATAADVPPTLATSHLRVSAPEGVEAGSPFSVSVTALNAEGAIITGYRGTIEVATSDPAGLLPGQYTFGGGDAGVHTLSGITLETPGPQSITVSDTAVPAISGTVSVAVAGTPVAAGGTVWSNGSGDPPDAATPLVVGVTSPQAGSVAMTLGHGVGLASPGYRPVPLSATVLGPVGSPSSPLAIDFELLASDLGGPVSDGSVSVYRGGVLVPACSGSDGVASPDPCLSTEGVGFGLVQLNVLASAGGSWIFGVAKVARVAGPDRVATAIAISQASYPVGGSAGAVVLARDDTYPDALAGTPLAAARNAPLLLTPPDSLDPRVAAEVQRVLEPGATVYILGGSIAVSDGVQAAVSGLGYRVVRYAGADRYQTAAVIADAGLGDPTTVLEATGLDFPDALAAGAAAAALHAAVLLTSGTAMPPATESYLADHPPVKRYAVGAPAAAADPGATPLTGADRYATAAAVAGRFFPDPTLVGLASGVNWPDGLAGGTRVGGRGGPLLLTDPSQLPASTGAYLTTAAGTVESVEVYGGTAAVEDQVEPGLQAAIGG